MTLAELNAAPPDKLTPKLLECCGSANWANHVVAGRPFQNLKELEDSSSLAWRHLKPSDWLEAFARHPKIGEKGKVSAWSQQEQSGMDNAAAHVASRLADLNQLYFDKFGYIFIVCATAKSAEEMLHLLETRLPNQPDQELQIAAAEQEKITLLRLRKLLA